MSGAPATSAAAYREAYSRLLHAPDHLTLERSGRGCRDAFSTGLEELREFAREPALANDIQVRFALLLAERKACGTAGAAPLSAADQAVLDALIKACRDADAVDEGEWVPAASYQLNSLCEHAATVQQPAVVRQLLRTGASAHYAWIRAVSCYDLEMLLAIVEEIEQREAPGPAEAVRGEEAVAAGA